MLKIAVPFVDLRGKTPVDLLRAYPDKAHQLVIGAKRMYGILSRALSPIALPLADRRSHAWLKRTNNPYLHEIETVADVLGRSGIYTLNLSYEWGCTSGAWRTGETVSMLRVLDWPFPSLGRHVVVALQSGKAGDFYNVTWPGLSGVFTGMAPERFSAAINLAPMRMHGLGFAGDWIKNRFIANKESGLPPAHLLRQVFETAPDYDTAKQMLQLTPVAAPVIFTLAGIKPGQGCIIERLENASEIFELSASQQVCSANHFNSGFSQYGKGWRPREIDSPGRHRQGCAIPGHDLAELNFNWLNAPIINTDTRLAVLADATTRRLMVQGFEGITQVTGLFNLPAAEIEHETREAI